MITRRSPGLRPLLLLAFAATGCGAAVQRAPRSAAVDAVPIQSAFVPAPPSDAAAPRPPVLGSSNGSSTPNVFAPDPSAPPTVSPLDTPVARPHGLSFDLQN